MCLGAIFEGEFAHVLVNKRLFPLGCSQVGGGALLALDYEYSLWWDQLVLEILENFSSVLDILMWDVI